PKWRVAIESFRGRRNRELRGSPPGSGVSRPEAAVGVSRLLRPLLPGPAPRDRGRPAARTAVRAAVRISSAARRTRRTTRVRVGDSLSRVHIRFFQFSNARAKLLRSRRAGELRDFFPAYDRTGAHSWLGSEGALAAAGAPLRLLPGLFESDG